MCQLSNVWDRDDVNCPCSELDGLDCKTPGYKCSIMNVLNKAVYYPSKAIPGAWNDLDMLRKFHFPPANPNATTFNPARRMGNSR